MLLPLIAAGICLLSVAASAQGSWRVTLADGEADRVELIDVSNDSLTIGRQGLRQSVPLSSLVGLRRNGGSGVLVGALVGGGAGALLGTLVNSIGFSMSGALLGALIGSATASHDTYDLVPLERSTRHDLLLHLIEEER